ncbi:carbohydrate-binding module family 20 domain-containing protein [Planomonospora sp. ID82291]|uniref:carbohydrate-binding module family 20 domain-containing protein n=1 Tax=Planomonospora sp. ID82291 TaxID=2738136 RepID=UPI0018C39E8C|nr:carbohydrate-binding module family 20 domain-containing protein [Planomonospora sp. ID82291]MBG0817691.1 alpha amylase C-terminal domain-containing protein [Planomonospora sp. ID82291]
MRSYKPPVPLTAAALSVLAGAALLAPAALGAAAPATAQAAPPAGTGPIVKLWSWNWNSVARECTDVLGPAGYGTVQVSPPHDSMSRGGSVWWDVYQPARYTLTSKFGDENAFRNMVRACHDAGVKVHVDAVVNHMTGQGSTSYGGYRFGKYDYPGLYSSWDFHNSPACVIEQEDYKKDGWRVQNCELAGLADLDTGSEYVRDQIAGWLNRLTSLGVDGFRVDAAKHIPPEDLAAIRSKLTGSPYLHLEVIHGEGEKVQPGQYTGIGDVHEFVFGRTMKEQFTGQIKWLRTFGESWGLSVPGDRAVTFVDNHDTERNGSTLNHKYGDTYRLANVFMLAWPYGTPRVYSGFTWSDSEAGPPSAGGGFVTDTDCGNGRWTCFHRQMTGMVGFHRAVAGTPVANWYDNGDNLIAFSRGSRGWVAINNQSGSVTRTFATGLPAGTYPNVAGSGSVTVDGGGDASVTVPAKGAVAIRLGTGPTPSPTPTATSDEIATSFNANVTTSWGQNVFVVGDVAELGSWNPANAVALSAASYPVWKATVNLPAGKTISYKYVKKNPDGSVTWESDPDRSFTTPAGGTATRTDTWR